MDEFAGKEWVSMVLSSVVGVSASWLMGNRDTIIVRRLDSVCGVQSEVEV